MDAPTKINELAARILRKEPVSDEELAQAVAEMRSHRVGSTERAKIKEKATTFDLDAFFGDTPNVGTKQDDPLASIFGDN
jgi:hypothetical protein